MITVIGASISLLGLIFKLYLDYRNEKNRPKTLQQDIQLLHNSIAKGDADTLSDLFDGLCRPPSQSDRKRYDDPTPS